MTAVTNSGSYTLIDNFGAVGNLNYVDASGNAITIGTEFNTAYGKATLSVVDDSLKMNFTAADTVSGIDTVAMDVDAVLNGTNNVSAVEITGITDLKTDVAGAKTIIGSVDDVLASAKIDNVDAVLGSATKIFDASTTADTTDTDVWASLTKNSDGSLTVAWGRSEAEVSAALDAFNTSKSSLALGESLVADASGLADGEYSDCFQLDDKKSKGTLA